MKNYQIGNIIIIPISNKTFFYHYIDLPGKTPPYNLFSISDTLDGHVEWSGSMPLLDCLTATLVYYSIKAIDKNNIISGFIQKVQNEKLRSS